MTSRCWAEIDLEALRHNAEVCREAVRPGCAIMAIVKAGGYGHGLSAVARALDDRVESFGVATLGEARQLSEALGTGSAKRVLVLSPLLPDEREEAVAAGYAVPVSNLEEVTDYAAAAQRAGVIALVHAVVDTGMGRMGAAPAVFPELVQAVRETEGLALDGIASHFPSADEDETFSRSQLAAFQDLVTSLNLAPGTRVHLGNSAGLLRFGEAMEFTNEVRPGLALYGISPVPGLAPGERLRPAMAWKTRVTLVREIEAGDSISYGRTFIADRPLRTATLAAGYGDGYLRALSGQGTEVLIGGRRCPLLGRVTMDQVVVDVSGVPETEAVAGAEVVLMGTQGEESISAVELAEKAGTIPWEILTGITGRVARVYR